MHWLFLVIAILLEVAGTTSMKLSQGFTRWVPSLLLGAIGLIIAGVVGLHLSGGVH
jgi:small multidrug resistance pump